MKTQTSKTRICLSSLLLLPIIAILFYNFAEREYVEKETIETSEVLQIENDNLSEGATEAMMKEYNDWMKKLNNNSSSLFIPVGTWERLVAIYDLMSEEQRNSAETHPFLQEIDNMYQEEPNTPTTAQFKSWKNEKEFAIWLDGKHISNSELNNYKINDIAHYVGSSVNTNAKSKKFPQPFQFRLYTKDGFNEFYTEAYVSGYKEICNEYSIAIHDYLKGSQTDNSELRIIKAQADKFYKSFTKEELKKYNILPAPPLPSENKLKAPQSMAKKAQGGPNFEDSQEVYNPSFLEYIIEMEKDGASFYLDGKKITSNEAKSIAKNNKGKSTEMITQKDAKGKYVVKLSSSAKNNIYARSIDLKILNDNSYLIDGIKATKGTFTDVFNQLHQDITLEVRNKIMNINVSSSKEISNKETWFIYNSLQDYGFYRIVTPNQDINRAKGNTPFAIESSFSTQQKATAKQVADYNAWAKKLNTAMAKAEASNDYANLIVKQKDVEKYKRIYMKLMSVEQRKNAEPFPNFPPPPPPPAPEKAIDKSGPIEINGATYYFIQENGKTTYYDRYGKVVDINKIPPPPPIATNATAEQKADMQKAQDAYNNARQESGEVRSELTGYTEINGEKLYYISENGKTTYFNRYGKEVKMDNLPPPPPAPESQELKERTVIGYPKSGKSNENKEIIVEGYPSKSAKSKDLEPITVKGYPSKSAAAQGSETTLDFVIRMAKANAKFIDSGKEITSDKAIDIIKNNPKLSASAQKTDTKQPIVYIYEVVGRTKVNGKVGEQMPNNIMVNGKVVESSKLKMIRNEFKKLKLSLTNGDIVSFKLKIPGVKTEQIQGNNITKETIKNLNLAKSGFTIAIFDIKDNKDNKIAPLIIEITD